MFVFKLYQYSEQHLWLSSKPISTGTYFKVLQSISKYAAQQHCTCKLLHSLIYINADKKPGYQLSPLSRGLDDFSIILSTKKCFKSKYTLKIILNADTHLLRIIQNIQFDTRLVLHPQFGCLSDKRCLSPVFLVPLGPYSSLGTSTHPRGQ